jgi:hypothetical protein
MYGIVNKAIEELVLQDYGVETWLNVKRRSGVDFEFFISNQSYADEDTFKLAIAISEEINISLHQVLVAFGEFWVLKTGKEKYGGLMAAGGHSLENFLMNLPSFHNRIMLIYPNLQPPEFKVNRMGNQALEVHYFSHREGLQAFVQGLLQGLAKLFQTDASVTMVQSRTEDFDHEVFHVTW